METKKQRSEGPGPDLVKINSGDVRHKASVHEQNVDARDIPKDATKAVGSGVPKNATEAPPAFSRSSTRAPSMNSIEAVILAGAVEPKSGNRTPDKSSESCSSSMSSVDTDESESDASPSGDDTEGQSDEDPC